MSAGSLNGGTLAVSKLTIGGQTFTGASGLAGLLGSATGSVTTTAGTVNVSVATGAQTGVLTTASTMVLPPGSASEATSLVGSANGSVPTTATSIQVSVSPTAQTGVLTTADTMVLPPAGTGSGIPTLTTTPATGETGNLSTAFSATITRNAGSDTAVFTGSASSMALAINVTPGASGLPSLYSVTNRVWANTGTTDPITITALPAGTYAVAVSWAMASAPPGILTCPPPTAGATTLQVVCGSSVTAGAGINYTVVVYKLT